MSTYRFYKTEYGYERLLADVEATVGRSPTESEIGCDEEGNIVEVTLTFDPPLTGGELAKLQKFFTEMGLTGVETKVESASRRTI